VAKKLGFDECYGNQLFIRDNKIMGQIVDPVLGPEAKLAQLKKTAALKNIFAEDVCAVGDGANDLPMILAAGLGVAYRAKPILNQKATHIVRFANLRALLWAQGYRKSDLA
jgi:phosphoserine phosphatase